MKAGHIAIIGIGLAVSGALVWFLLQKEQAAAAKIFGISVSPTQNSPGGTLTVNITVQNTGATPTDVVVGCSIGKSVSGFQGEWHDIDIYNDSGNPNLIQIPGQAANAYVHTGAIQPGQTATVYRTFYLDPNKNPSAWKDVYASARDINLVSYEEKVFYNQFSVTG